MGWPFFVFCFLNLAFALSPSTLMAQSFVSFGSLILDNSANCRRQWGHQ